MSKELEAIAYIKDSPLYQEDYYARESIYIIEQAIKRNKPMKPLKREHSIELDCPVCKKYVGWKYDHQKYCPHCGQRLDWSNS